MKVCGCETRMSHSSCISACFEFQICKNFQIIITMLLILAHILTIWEFVLKCQNINQRPTKPKLVSSTLPQRLYDSTWLLVHIFQPRRKISGCPFGRSNYHFAGRLPPFSAFILIHYSKGNNWTGSHQGIMYGSVITRKSPTPQGWHVNLNK